MFIRRLGLATAAVFAGASLLFLYGHDPSAHPFYPRCLFHLLTGLQCPGCGATRALYQLLHLHVGPALRLNALLVLSSPLLTFAGATECAAIWSDRKTNLMRRPWIGWTAFVLVVGWGVLRNV